MRFKKGLSLMLSLVLMAQMCLPATANSPVDSGVGEIVCNHHAEHTSECGYTAEGGACTFDPANCPECNSVPEKPTEPTVPEKPVEPTVPEVPVVPEKPEVPTVPEKPEVPTVPEAPALGAPKVELAADGVIDVGNPDRYIVITDTGYKIGDATTETQYIGPYVLSGTATSTNEQYGFHISVRRTAPLDITINNLNIQLTQDGKCAFAIEQGAVNLTLVGENTLKSADQRAGLQVSEGSSLTITQGSTGSLTAIGGENGAGIGAGLSNKSSEIAINGGVVTASGGGAGIGGSKTGIGVSNAGSFYATGSNAVIFASSISDNSQSAGWKGMIFEGSSGTICGTNDFTLPGNVTIPKGYTLEMKAGQTLTVPEGKTLTINGIINKNGGKVEGPGTIVYPKPSNIPSTNISNGDVSIGSCGGNCKGHAITGTTTTNKIIVSGGTHDITLIDANIRNESACAFELRDNATVRLTILGSNTLQSASSYAGIQVPPESFLSITDKSTGTLNVTGGKYGAGIGSGYNSGAGTISISGGTVNTQGGYYGAGIGGGEYGTGGTIAIYGGTVTAKGGYYGAGIGSGDEAAKNTDTQIFFHGGTVTATGGNEAAGVGGGNDSAGGYIIIYGGNVTATGTDYGAGIGGGDNGDGGIIRISGGTVTAKGGSWHAGSINFGAAGIGGGDNGDSGTINISGGTVKASASIFGAGIGGGQNGNCNADISGGTVEASGGEQGAGIGSGASGGNATIKISGGHVTAHGGKDGGAGIGSASKANPFDLRITGGTVYGYGGFTSPKWDDVPTNPGAGIGAGYYSWGGNITIDGDAVVMGHSISSWSRPIGEGYLSSPCTITYTRGIVFEGNNRGTFYGNHVALKSDFEAYGGMHLRIRKGQTLTIPAGITYKSASNSTMDIDGGTIDGSGNIKGDGDFGATMVSGDIADISDQVYTGKAITPEGTVNPTRNILGKDFTVNYASFTKSYDDNINVGTAKVLYTMQGYPVAEKRFNIVKAGTTFEGGIKVYNGTTETTEFTYGDTITVKAKPVLTGEATNSLALMAAPIAHQMALYLGDVQLCEPVNPGSDGLYTMTYKTTEKGLALGSNCLTAKYVGDNNMADFSEPVTVELKVKPIRATVKSTVKGTVTKWYDGNPSFGNLPLTLIGIESGDIITATADGGAASANAGTHAFIASAITLVGANRGYYTLLLTDVSGNVKIKPAIPRISLTVAKLGNDLLLTVTSSGPNNEKPYGNLVLTYANEGDNGIITTMPVVDGVASYQWINPPAGYNVMITAKFAASGSNYITSEQWLGTNVIVDRQIQAALSITPVSGKTYGDGSFALSTTGGSGNGAVTYNVTSGDAFTVSGNTATIVKPGAVTLTATKKWDRNYKSITSEPITIIIGAKPVTVTVTAQNKVYDGTTDANVSYMVSGTVGSDTITATGAGATFADKNVDTGKTVTATGITISGGNVNNYALGNTTATTKANITKKPLTWGASGTVVSKDYDGSTTAEVTKKPGLVDVLSGDNVTVTNGTVTFANANVGNHAVTATGFGIDNANYSAPAGQPTFENGTITVKNVQSPTVEVSGTHKFTGSQIKPAADKIVVTDNGAKISATNYTVTYGENINAGTGSVKVTLKGNYSGNATKTFTIDKAPRGNVTNSPILMKASETRSIPLPQISNAGKVEYSVGEPTDATIFSQVPTVVGTNLNFACETNATDKATSTVVITIKSDNYETFTVQQPFEVSGKTTVAITGLAATDGTYNGKPHSGYTGTILVEGCNVSAKELVYTYTGISGTTYAANTAPIKAGTYMLTIAVPVSNNDYTGSHEIITFTIAKKEVTVKANTYTVTKPWDGNTTAVGTPSGALSVSGILKDEATVTATPREYPSSAVSDSHSVIVDLALTGTGSSNYVLANNTITVTGKITKSEGSPAAPSAPILETKSATAITLKPVTVDGEVVEYAKGDNGTTPGTWQSGTTFGELKANKKYFFFARVAKNDNHGAGAASIGTAITTEKKVFDPDHLYVRSFRIVNGSVWESEYTLDMLFSSDMPTGATLKSIQTLNALNVLDSIKIENNEIKFKSKNNPVGTSKTDAVTVTVATDEYQDFDLTIAFPTREKVSAVITATMGNTVYNGKPVSVPTSISAKGDGNTVDLTYTYQWKQGSNVLGTAPKDAGDYTLVISGSNGSYVGSLTIPFTISKKPLTVTAADKFIVRNTAPEFTFTSKGLVPGETLTNVAYDCTYNNSMARTAIIPKGGKVSSSNDNYTISYVPGTLTISPDKDALEAAIKEAEALKSSVETSDKAPNEMAYGKRFVPSEAMIAFENAIASAKLVTNFTPQNIADAMAALAEATNAFKTAIKTGTYSYSDDDVEPSPQPTPQKHPADKFTDIKGHWAEESIRFVVEKNLFNGISETLFAPDMTMTRGMLVTVLYRQAGSPTVEADKTTWYSTARAWAMQAEISDGTNMENTVTRQELVTMLHRYAKHSGIDVSVGEDTNILSYNDAFDLPLWSIPAFQWACGADIVDGISGSLLPTETATRAQVATMLKRFAALKAK